MNLLMAFSEILKCLPLNDRQHFLSQQMFLQSVVKIKSKIEQMYQMVFSQRNKFITRVKQFLKNKIYNLKIIQMH